MNLDFTTGLIAQLGVSPLQQINVPALAAAAASSATAAASSATAAASSAASINLATPGPIGATTPNTAKLTTLGVSGSLSLGNATARTPFAHSTYYAPVAGVMQPAFLSNGNAFGVPTSGAAFYRSFNVDSDTVDATAAQGGGVNVNYFGHSISAGAVGGRTTLSVFMSQQGATASGGANQFYVAGACFGEASFSAGGTGGVPTGNLFATNHSARLKTGAGPYWNSLTGEEVDVSVQPGTAVIDKVGFKVVQWADDAVSGSRGDYAIGVNNQANGTAPGWTLGYAVGGPEGWWPMKGSGTILGTAAAVITGGPSMACAYGVDLSAVTFSGAFLKSTGFAVDGSGNATANSVRITPAIGLTAAGSTQGTGLALTKDLNVVSTTAASTGVVLPTAAPGMEILVFNRGASTLNVYPGAGAQIEALGANVATTVATLAKVRMVAVSTTQWLAA
jgi:hypothetical protein